MTRKRFTWKVRDFELVIGERTLVMGVLNVTPDSFSDGGKYSDPDRAFARAVELEEEGADIIDVGAESTRPGSERISEAEELRRLVPVLKRLKGRINVPISVDTYKAGVAEKAIEHGASIINDPSGLTFDPALAKVVAQHDAGLILNHMRGTPDTWAKLGPMKDVMGTIRAELEAAVHRARRTGVLPQRIIVDPGIGFGKRKEQNSEILARLAELQQLGLPILVGVSRKSFLTQVDARQTEFATAGAVAAAILYGANIVRVHDVATMKASIEMADQIVSAAPERRQEMERPARRPAAEPVKEVVPEQRPERPPRREEERPPRREFRPAPDREEKRPRRFGPPPDRERKGPPRKFGPPPDRERKGPPRKFGPPPDREREGPPRKFGPPPDREREGPPRKFGPPSDRESPRKFGPRPGGDRKGPPRKFGGPPRGPRKPKS